MSEDLKKYRVVVKGKNSRIHMTLMARSKDEAEKLAGLSEHRRHGRFPLTFDRIQQAHERGELTSEQFKAEMERRKRDQARYDDSEFKIESVEARRA